MAIQLDSQLHYLYSVIASITSFKLLWLMLALHTHGHSTGLPVALSLFCAYVSYILQAVMADAGSPQPWPFNWTSSCIIFIL
jgi:hypothetical protein